MSNYHSVARHPLYLALCYCAGVFGLVSPRHVTRIASRRPHSTGRAFAPPSSFGKLVDMKMKKSASENEQEFGTEVVDTSGLLGSIMRRAERTLLVRDEILAAEQGTGLQDPSQTVDGAPVAARELLREAQKGRQDPKSPPAARLDPLVSDDDRELGGSSDSDDDEDDDLLSYGANPTITMTALAHTLWKSVIRPGKDSAIDATAGNGGDAVALAQLLFSHSKRKSNVSHLVCIDIQKDACDTTQAKLFNALTEETLSNHVSVIHGSHAPLTLPPIGSAPVAVVAYNLGYLPGQERTTESTITQMSTTLSSLTDAVLCLRIGGVLSVLTYPQTNSVEDAAVQAFVEGLALLSSQSHDWRDFLVESDLVRYPALDNPEPRREVRQRLEYVHNELGARQCWRVHVHEKLGWVNAPRLLTATRVR